MLQQITKENLQQMMARFSTVELENLVVKFPYFQQAHLLLAKKYQQENSPKFDQQLQLAALYTQDRELFYNIFNDTALVKQPPPIAPLNLPKGEPLIQPEVQFEMVAEKQPVDQAAETLITTATVEFPVKEEMVVLPEEPAIKAKKPDEVSVPVLEIIEDTAAEEVDINMEEEGEEPLPFMYTAPHTFDEWLKAFNRGPKVAKQEASIEEPTDEDLDNLIRQNVSVDYLHELVKEETQYARGLDKFIEDQIQKHKQNEVKTPATESELAAELITETMAKVYEMQKKYGKAIKAYEILALKFPKKSGLFAARINYLKNII